MELIIIILLSAICGILYYFLQKRNKQLQFKVEKDLEIEKANRLLKDTQQKLQQDIDYLRQEYQVTAEQKEKALEDLSKLENNLDTLTSQSEKIATDAYSNYVASLEQSYQETEANFDFNMRFLKQNITNLNQELDKLKATRAAAHEALLKEQEVKENKDNYKLSPSQSDLADARRLEVVKRELNKPRILSMLIWQTYWQPIAKKQFPIILQAKTKCGIYKITNQITDECYIGQAVDVYKRWNEHCKCGLGIDTPPGNKLYKSIQEYGLENFTFELLTECDSKELNEKEKYFIELYQADIYGLNSQGGNK